MERPYILVVSLYPLDATTTLFFGHLRAICGRAIEIVTPQDARLAGLIAGADAVIIVRALFECAHIAWWARVAGVPHYYFVDDNFIVLREQGGESARFVLPYSAGSVRRALRSFDGVLLATEPLAEYFAEQALHQTRLVFPPSLVPGSPLPKPASSTLRIAFFGGRHLHAKLLQVVLPAVRRLAAAHDSTLILMGVAADLPDSKGLEILQLPYEASYSRGLAVLAAHGVDIIVHPSATGMQNNAYKNPHALITALALGAVPIVSNTSPYDALRLLQVVLLSDDEADAWFEVLSLAADREFRDRACVRLAAHCATAFDGRRNRAAIEAMPIEHRHHRRNVPFWVLRWGLAAATAARAAARAASAISDRFLARAA